MTVGGTVSSSVKPMLTQFSVPAIATASFEQISESYARSTGAKNRF
jgi:hypothetical protein